MISDFNYTNLLKGEKLSRELEDLETEKEKDDFILKNIRDINLSRSEEKRIKKLRDQGRAKYVSETYSGYWVAIPKGG